MNPSIPLSTTDWLQPYVLLAAHYGPQHWWPGDTPFEVMVGAVLTQNTAWGNVEKAIDRLRRADALGCPAILARSETELAELIRPAGFYRVKARRLGALCAFLETAGVALAPERLATLAPLAPLRRRLLAVHGIGEETADSILLYALDLPSFVVDAYTRRVFGRLGWLTGRESYGEIRHAFMTGLPEERSLFNEYHALIVRLGKDHCRTKPRCAGCPLASLCPSRTL